MIINLPIPSYVYSKILMIKFNRIDNELDKLNERLEEILR
jgi:hypothetical protein